MQFQCIEVIHPDFSTTHRFVRNATSGIKAVHEDASGPFIYQYLPMQIRHLGVTSSLDQSLEITFGDVGQILPTEIQLIAEANGFKTKPVLKYREYRSDNVAGLTGGEPVYMYPMYGPFTLEVNGLAFNKTGCTFTAKPPAVNRARTGEIYDVGRFPMLTGFL